MTAKRYKPEQQQRQKTKPKGWLLLILPLPLVFAVLVSLGKGALGAVLTNSFGFALFIAGAILARKGFRIEQEYHRRKIARAPRIPYKLIAGMTVAFATGITAFNGVGYSLLNSLAFSIATLLGYYLLYGIDPRQDKMGSTIAGVTAKEVLDALEEAENTIESIEAAAAKIGHRELRLRLNRITTQAQAVLRAIEEDPKDLRRARKFLVVYLQSTQQVTEGYARTHKKAGSQQLEDNFRRVLDSIEHTFKEQQEKLLKNDVFDLDVQIEVLQAQLKREGIL